jgi:hypothetical protein
MKFEGCRARGGQRCPDVLHLLREGVMRMEDPHEVPEVVQRVAKVAVYEAGSDDPAMRTMMSCAFCERGS